MNEFDPEYSADKCPVKVTVAGANEKRMAEITHIHYDDEKQYKLNFGASMKARREINNFEQNLLAMVNNK